MAIAVNSMQYLAIDAFAEFLDTQQIINLMRIKLIGKIAESNQFNPHEEYFGMKLQQKLMRAKIFEVTTLLFTGQSLTKDESWKYQPNGIPTLIINLTPKNITNQVVPKGNY